MLAKQFIQYNLTESQSRSNLTLLILLCHISINDECIKEFFLSFAACFSCQNFTPSGLDSESERKSLLFCFQIKLGIFIKIFALFDIHS